MGRFTHMECTKRENILEKRQFRVFLRGYRKMNPKRGTRGFLHQNFDPFSRVFLFERLTHSYLISAPLGLYAFNIPHIESVFAQFALFTELNSILTLLSLTLGV